MLAPRFATRTTSRAARHERERSVGPRIPPRGGIHRRSDVIENIDFDRLARVVAGLDRTIIALAAP
jgi:hypothetical protein